MKLVFNLGHLTMEDASLKTQMKEDFSYTLLLVQERRLSFEIQTRGDVRNCVVRDRIKQQLSSLLHSITFVDCFFQATTSLNTVGPFLNRNVFVF